LHAKKKLFFSIFVPQKIIFSQFSCPQKLIFLDFFARLNKQTPPNLATVSHIKRYFSIFGGSPPDLVDLLEGAMCHLRMVPHVTFLLGQITPKKDKKMTDMCQHTVSILRKKYMARIGSTSSTHWR
jgi:hypothetical protein